jgi:pimeloyl-ACP methyl ester carboxylesterase
MNRKITWMLRAVVLAMILAGSGLAGAMDARAAAPLHEPARAVPLTGNQTYGVVYRAWNGHPRSAVVVLPKDYVPGGNEPLPCIIQPHARHATPAYTATIWQDLPTTHRFMVICPDSAGRVSRANGWGVPGQIADIMDMPDVVEATIPWAHVDRERLYVVGVSMGGQEALDTLARFPDRFAAAAVYDGVSDLAARYHELAMVDRLRDQRDMRNEVGGTPANVPFRYRIRSSKPFATTLARCRVPLSITWSTEDKLVIRQAKTQTGSLCTKIRSIDAGATLTETVTAAAHGLTLRNDPLAALEFLAPGGTWRMRPVAAPSTWSYGSWLRRVDVWGYTFSAGSKITKLWQATVEPGRISLRAPVPMTVTMPWSGGDPVQVMLNETALSVAPVDGRLTISFPTGDGLAVFTPPQ